MPYLQCPRCHRTAWLRPESAEPIDCRHCGRPLEASPADLRLLTAAVRARLARDARAGAGMKRFLRPGA